ncbi:MAG: hypothetical protein ACLTSX_00400 [Collinsella sp.]
MSNRPTSKRGMTRHRGVPRRCDRACSKIAFFKQPWIARELAVRRAARR